MKFCNEAMGDIYELPDGKYQSEYNKYFIFIWCSPLWCQPVLPWPRIPFQPPSWFSQPLPHWHLQQGWSPAPRARAWPQALLSQAYPTVAWSGPVPIPREVPSARGTGPSFPHQAWPWPARTSWQPSLSPRGLPDGLGSWTDPGLPRVGAPPGRCSCSQAWFVCLSCFSWSAAENP